VQDTTGEDTIGEGDMPDIDDLSTALKNRQETIQAIPSKLRVSRSPKARERRLPKRKIKSPHFYIVPVGLTMLCIIEILVTVSYTGIIKPSAIIRLILTLGLSTCLLTGQKWARMLSIVLLSVGLGYGIIVLIQYGQLVQQMQQILMPGLFGLLFVMMVFYVYSLVVLSFCPSIAKLYK
jgi:hypothetical protein